jgi:hypothetical protein
MRGSLIQPVTYSYKINLLCCTLRLAIHCMSKSDITVWLRVLQTSRAYWSRRLKVLLIGQGYDAVVVFGMYVVDFGSGVAGGWLI